MYLEGERGEGQKLGVFLDSPPASKIKKGPNLDPIDGPQDCPKVPYLWHWIYGYDSDLAVGSALFGTHRAVALDWLCLL